MVGRYRSLEQPGHRLGARGAAPRSLLSSHRIGGTLQGMDRLLRVNATLNEPSRLVRCVVPLARSEQPQPLTFAHSWAAGRIPFSSAILSGAAVSCSPSLIGPQVIQRLTLAKPVATKKDPTEPPSEPTHEKRIAKGKGATFCMCQERCPLTRPY